MTHSYIKRCDEVWVVAPISRIVDDATVYSLLSRYGKPFNGRVCVIGRHADEGIVGAERKLVNHLKQEDQDMSAFETFTEAMKGKSKEMTKLKRKIEAGKRKKMRAKKAEMMELREEEDNLKTLKRELEKIKSRNTLVIEQLREMLQSCVPAGMVLPVHCISNYHYAAFSGTAVTGPRLTVEMTGIPALRAYALGLPAPGLFKTMLH